MSLEVYVAETFGTMLLLLLGTGVVANVALAKTKGNNGGFLMVNFGWGLAVFAGVYVAALSGAHLNFAVTIGLLTSDAAEYAPGVDKTFATTLAYLAAQMIGSILGAVLCWLSYKQHFDDEQRHGERTEAGGRSCEGDDDEDEDEGGDDLRDEVPPVGADGRAGGEDAELVGGLGLVVEVLLVREPAEHGAED